MIMYGYDYIPIFITDLSGIKIPCLGGPLFVDWRYARCRPSHSLSVRGCGGKILVLHKIKVKHKCYILLYPITLQYVV